MGQFEEHQPIKPAIAQHPEDPHPAPHSSPPPGPDPDPHPDAHPDPHPESDIEQRNQPDRRFHDRRQYERRQHERRQGDRRVTPIEQRLRRGLWKSYAWKHEIGQDALLPRSAYYPQRLIDDLALEASSYQFFNKYNHGQVTYDKALEEAVEEVLTALGRRDRKAVYVIEEIAEIINSKYRLEPVDRRTTERRATERRATERRDQHRRQSDKRNHLN